MRKIRGKDMFSSSPFLKWKGKSIFDEARVYCPYIPLTVSDVVYRAPFIMPEHLFDMDL
jgi:hypothetical protein